MKATISRTLTSLLGTLAERILRKYKPRIIAITGNVGKTTTKDAIYAALSSELPIRKNYKSFNTDLGVPLTIIDADNPWSNPLKWLLVYLKAIDLLIRTHDYPKWLILEMGADHRGDIKRLTSWVRPHIAVFTGVPKIPAHVEYFNSAEELFLEKKELLKGIPENGAIILNGDDSRAADIVKEFGSRVITYGTGIADEKGGDIAIAYTENAPSGMSFSFTSKKNSGTCVVSGSLGTPRVLSALAALATAEVVGVSLSSALSGLEKWEPTPGRMRIIEGRNGSTLIDDSYNSSPSAAIEALKTLHEIKATKRIAILGDMRELGVHSKEAHTLVGALAAHTVDQLITVGDESRALADATEKDGFNPDNITRYDYGESEKAALELLPHIGEGNVVLIKGSQNKIRLEKAVKILMLHPERASELLVRQEPEWQNI